MKRKLNPPPAGQPYLMSVAERHFVSVPGIVMSKERVGVLQLEGSILGWEQERPSGRGR